MDLFKNVLEEPQNSMIRQLSELKVQFQQISLAESWNNYCGPIWWFFASPHGPHMRHRVPILIFVALLIVGACRTIRKCVLRYSENIYQTVGISALLAGLAWPLIHVHCVWGVKLQKLLYWSVFYAYESYGVTCDGPSLYYRRLFWSRSYAPCVIRQENVGLTAFLTLLLVSYKCDYASAVTDSCLYVFMWLLALVKWCTWTVAVIVLYVLKSVCRLICVIVKMGMTSPCPRIVAAELDRVNDVAEDSVASGKPCADSACAPLVDIGNCDDVEGADDDWEDEEDEDSDIDLITFDTDSLDGKSLNGLKKWLDQKESVVA